jgi:hypothetical protein
MLVGYIAIDKTIKLFSTHSINYSQTLTSAYQPTSQAFHPC